MRIIAKSVSGCFYCVTIRVSLLVFTNKMNLTETLISSKPIDHSSFLQIDRDTIRLPNGNEQTRTVIRHPGAACILAITPDNKVVLVKQWRHATGYALLEIPAGKLDENEDPAACALRELGEETPILPNVWKKSSRFIPPLDFAMKCYICIAPSTSHRRVPFRPTKTNS